MSKTIKTSNQNLNDGIRKRRVNPYKRQVVSEDFDWEETLADELKDQELYLDEEEDYV